MLPVVALDAFSWSTLITQSTSDILTNAESMVSGILPIIGGVMALTIGVKLFKRFLGKI